MDFITHKLLDFSYNFPRPEYPNTHQLPLGKYYDQLVDWKTPIFSSIAYYIIVIIWKSQMPSNNNRKPGTASSKASASKISAPFKLFVLFHNLALFVFSLATFVAVAPRVYKNFASRNLKSAICDKEEVMWTYGIGYWTWLFYLSKYYEVVDTLILLLKGRKPSLLQSYHHAGAIICLWLGVLSKSTAIWVFTCFNSFVHTIMYLYYAMTTVGISPPGKKYITRMQITQFLVGGSLSSVNLFIPNCLKKEPGLENVEFFGYFIVLGYLVPLTSLFLDFARQAYGEKKKVIEKEQTKKE